MPNVPIDHMHLGLKVWGLCSWLKAWSSIAAKLSSVSSFDSTNLAPSQLGLRSGTRNFRLLTNTLFTFPASLMDAPSLETLPKHSCKSYLEVSIPKFRTWGCSSASMWINWAEPSASNLTVSESGPFRSKAAVSLMTLLVLCTVSRRS